MSWDKGIIVAFVLFFIMLCTLVMITMRHDVELVEEEYYKEEIAYQDQIQRIQNYHSLKEKPTIQYRSENKELFITFPKSLSAAMQEGELLLYRPSNAKMDKKVILQLDEQGLLKINVASLANGLWTAKLKWQDATKEYYQEVNLIL